jgi:hypothetical protein
VVVKLADRENLLVALEGLLRGSGASTVELVLLRRQPVARKALT